MKIAVVSAAFVSLLSASAFGDVRCVEGQHSSYGTKIWETRPQYGVYVEGATAVVGKKETAVALRVYTRNFISNVPFSLFRAVNGKAEWQKNEDGTNSLYVANFETGVSGLHLHVKAQGMGGPNWTPGTLHAWEVQSAWNARFCPQAVRSTQTCFEPELTMGRAFLARLRSARRFRLLL